MFRTLGPEAMSAHFSGGVAVSPVPCRNRTGRVNGPSGTDPGSARSQTGYQAIPAAMSEMASSFHGVPAVRVLRTVHPPWLPPLM